MGGECKKGKDSKTLLTKKREGKYKKKEKGKVEMPRKLQNGRNDAPLILLSKPVEMKGSEKRGGNVTLTPSPYDRGGRTKKKGKGN